MHPRARETVILLRTIMGRVPISARIMPQRLYRGRQAAGKGGIVFDRPLEFLK